MSRHLKLRPINFLLPVGLFALVAAGGIVAGRVLDRSAERRFEDDLRQAGTLTVLGLEQSMSEQRRSLDYAARAVLPLEVALQTDADVVNSLQDFGSIGSSIAAWLPGFLSVNWVGTDGEIKLVSPTVPNQNAVGRKVSEHPVPEVREAFARSVNAERESSARCEYTPLIDLYQGGRGFAVYRAVFNRNGVVCGVLNAAFRLNDLLEHWIPGERDNEHASYAVLDEYGQVLYSTSPEALREPWPLSSDLTLHVLDETWTLRVGPTDAWLEAGLDYVGAKLSFVGIGLGAIFGLIAFSFGRKRWQKEEADLRLGLALDGARMGVWDLDVPSQTLHLNAQWMQMLGYSEGEVDFDLKRYRDLVHPDDIVAVEAAMNAHLSGGTDSYRTEHRLRTPNGEWIWVLDAGRIVERDSAGLPVRVAGTQTNMTEAYAAKEALRWSMKRYRSIFEHSPVGIIEFNLSAIKIAFERHRGRQITDLHSYLIATPSELEPFEHMPIALDANQAFYALFQAQDQREYRTHLPRMVDARARWAFARGLSDLYADGRTAEFDLPLTSLSGESLLYAVRVMVAPGSEEDYASVFVTVVDNTRRLRVEEQRRVLEARDRQLQKDESLALLAGGVAHDFNNLLVPIIGSIELALGESDQDSMVAINLRRAEQASQRAAELARQMLTYSGRGQVQHQVFDMGAIVGEMSHLLASGLPGKVELRTELHPEPLAIEGDPTQLRQLVMNLVINAADASAGEAGEVTVLTGTGRPTAQELASGSLGEGLADKPCAVLEVRDTGKGLEEATLKRMFEPFFSTKATGRGLGMSVVLGIVRGHGGGLNVSSQIGKGTRIRVFLPLTLAPLNTSTPLVQPIQSDSSNVIRAALKGNVLVADDETQVQGFVREALARLGVEVTTVDNGSDALERWRAQPGAFDLVILDATMPRLGGVEAMEIMRDEDPTQPIVLASGYTEHEVATRVTEMPDTWFLPKPFGLRELIQIVGVVLGDEERRAQRKAQLTAAEPTD
jgi:PAS domain S-box-containing protein